MERQCRIHLLHNGEPVRPRGENEAGSKACGFGCRSQEPCWIEAGRLDVHVEELTGAWRRCGGRTRTGWPRAGGIADQDAGTVFMLEAIDGEIAKADRAALAAATPAGGKA